MRVTFFLSAALIGAGLLSSGAAHAALGEGGAAVAADAARMRASTPVSQAMPSYVRHEFTTREGQEIHEYVNARGQTFAIAWRSTNTQPKLEVLLGEHYSEYLKQARSRVDQHHVLIMHTGTLNVEVRRLPRGFVGVATLPAMIPAGVSAGDLK
jgi:hypothetical protein